MSPRRLTVLVTAGLAAATLTGCSFTSVADEAVKLTDARNAYVVSGGAERPASSGATLGKGDRVGTRTGGSVTLVVRDRRVVLGGSTEVVVPDGANIDLTRGALLVDRRRGPDLSLRVGDTTVDRLGTGALRVERSFSVLVTGLSAGARIRTTTGAELALKPLYQAAVAGRAPRAALPMQLRHDAWERDVVADLLAEDDLLNGLAADLDGPSAPIIPAAYRPGAGARVSDQVLADAIGRAAAKDTPARVSATSRARALRSEGGSWGVVARLLEVAVADVGTALSDVLAGVPATSPDPGTPGSTPGVVAGGSPQPGVSPSPSPTRGGPTRTPGPTPTTKPPTTSPTSPTGSPGVLDPVISVLSTPPVDIGL